jgi:hypothetical protein
MHQNTQGLAAVDQLTGILKNTLDTFPFVRRQALIFLPEGGLQPWRLGYGQVTSVKEKVAPSTLRYHRVLYEESYLSVEEAISWYEALAGRSEWIVDGHPIEIANPLQFTHSYETRKSYVPFSPCHHIRTVIQASQGGGWHFDPLLSAGQPVYPNINVLLQDKFGLQDLNGRTGNFGLYLPAHQASIEGVQAKGRKLIIEVAGAKPSDGLRVRAWARNGARHMSAEELIVTQERVEIRLPVAPQFAAVYVVDQKETLLDARDLTEGLQANNPITSERQVLQLIEQGESTTLEFKNYAGKGVFESQSSAVDVKEVAALLVAFANTRGGMLLIGVHDDGTIRGVDDARKTREKISEAAHDVCDPRLTPDLATIKVRKKTLVAAMVEKGETIHLAGSIPFIRRNATTRKATAGEVADIIEQTTISPLGTGSYLP